MCAHHVTSDTLPTCDSIVTVPPTCPGVCQTNANIDYLGDKHKSSTNYGFGGNVEAIKNDLYNYGSVSAAFTVYEDFLTYTGGVYYHQTGASLGGHAIKIIGWGNDSASGMDYWLCMNSWNNSWGVNGTFMIEMGNCGINNQVNAGLV